MKGLKPPAVGRPSLGELVALYATLGEPSDLEARQKTINQNIFVESRTEENELVGFLRAWIDTASVHGDGIIYEIAVHPAYQSATVGKKLLKFALELWPNVHWRGDATRISDSLNRHLTIVRIMYAVGLTFGFQKVVDATYGQFPGSFPKVSADLAASGPAECPKILLVLMFLGIGFLGVRLFWATGNIRRFLMQRVIQIQAIPNPPPTGELLMFHFPALIAHAILFFFLCRVYQGICANGLNDGDARGFTLMFVVLLWWNVIWLNVLRQGRSDPGPERFWIKNNRYFAVLGTLALCLFYLCPVLGKWELSMAVTILLANDAIDLFGTSHAYILGDAFGGG
jgi:GNAT superfamily N-acetyltransferase